MKNNLLFLLILLSFTAKCQYPEIENDRKTLKLNSEVKTLEEYTWRYFDGEKRGTFSSHNDFYTVFNEKGFEIKRIEYKQTSASHIDNFYLLEFEYNKNRLVEKTKSKLKDGEKIVYNFVYDSNGNLIEERKNDKTEVFYKYDKVGNLIEEKHYSNSDLWYAVKLNYVNDKEVEAIYYDKEEKFIKKIQTSYNEQGIKAEVFEYSENEYFYPYLNRQIRTYYNANGNIEKIVEYNGDGEIQEITKNKYDNFGNIVESSDYDKFGKISVTFTYSYEYDSNNNWIKKVMYCNSARNGYKDITERRIEYFY